MWLLSDSICSSEISRSVVDGTPSSSICAALGWARARQQIKMVVIEPG